MPKIGTIGKLIYRVANIGLTIQCSTCLGRILYGAMPNFCAYCGRRFKRIDDSQAQERTGAGRARPEGEAE